MADPNVDPLAFADELYEHVRPLAYADPENDYALKTVCYALGQMFAQVEELGRGDADENPPWSIIHDLDRAPGYVLPYIGQIIGQEIPIGMSEADARALLQSPSSWYRGTYDSLVAAARRTMVESDPPTPAYVRIIERDTSAYHFSVFTRTAETPNPALTLAELLKVKPAGLVMSFTVTDFETVDELTGTVNALSGTTDSL